MRLLFAAVVLVTAHALPSTNKCEQGESYWCSSIKTAISCEAFKTCVENVWKPQLLNVHQTDECLSSMKLIQEFRSQLSTDGKIKDLPVASICNLFKGEHEEEKCKELASQFMPEIRMLLTSATEASSVASLLGLCEAYEREEMPKEEIEIPSVEDNEDRLCHDCHKFSTGLKKMLRKHGKKVDFLGIMEKVVCSQLNDLEIWCKAVVNVAVPKLLKYIEGKDETDLICYMGTACDNKIKMAWWYNVIETAMYDIMDVIQMDTDKDVICHDCDKVLTSILAYEKESSFRESLNHVIELVCSKTGLSNETCRILSKRLIPKELFSMASHDLNVLSVCRGRLGCVDDDREPHIQADTVPDIQDNDISLVHKQISPYCSDCLQFFGDVSSGLRSMSVKNAVGMAQKKVCKGENTDFKCNDIVGASAKVLLEWLVRAESPQAICSNDIAMCPKSKGLPTFDIVKVFDAAWNNKKLGDFDCDSCLMLTEDISTMERDDNIEKSIVNYLNIICIYLEEETPQCRTLVQRFAPMLLETVTKELNPTMVCELLLRCTKTEYPAAENKIPQMSPLEKVEKNMESYEDDGKRQTKMSENSVMNYFPTARELKVSDSVQCATCKLAMDTLDNLIGTNATKKELESLLDDLCDILPSSVKTSCVQFVTEYTPAIIDFILQELDANLICDELQLCNKTKSEYRYSNQEPVMVKMPEIKHVPANEAGVGCELCQYILTHFSKEVGDERSEASVTHAVSAVCDVLPRHLKQQCELEVKAYGSEVLALLRQMGDPRRVCEIIKRCAMPDSNESDHNKIVVSDEEICNACQNLATYMKSTVQGERTQEEVELQLEKTCSLMPASLSQKCNTIIKLFSPHFRDMLVKEENPLHFCKSLKQCPPDFENAKSAEFGVDVCSYGPTFWCSSIQNARKCGVEQVCIEKYGMKP